MDDDLGMLYNHSVKLGHAAGQWPQAQHKSTTESRTKEKNQSPDVNLIKRRVSENSSTRMRSD